MVEKKLGANPFYSLLVIVGIVFTLTVCVYGVMTVRDLRHDIRAEASDSGQGLMQFMDRHGFKIMGIELAVLAVCTVGAMVTDDFWARRAARQEGSQHESPPQS